jgi:hypothetical protein
MKTQRRLPTNKFKTKPVTWLDVRDWLKTVMILNEERKNHVLEM